MIATCSRNTQPVRLGGITWLASPSRIVETFAFRRSKEWCTVVARNLLQQRAAEHELKIVSGQAARDHVHLFILAPAQSGCEPDEAVG
jgi:hypothetical protein